MRLSTVQVFQNGINSILSQQNQVNRTQIELSTGKKVLTPSDDPAAAAQILRIDSELSRVDQYFDNADLAESQLEFEEGLVDEAENVLQRVRELVLQANNAIQTTESRQAISKEIEERLQELVDIANSKNFNGDYVFSGFQASTAPFAVQSGTVSYSGDEGQRFAKVGASSEIAVGDPGSDVFMRIPSGNGSFAFSANAVNTGAAQVGATSADTNFISDSYTIEFSQVTPGDPVTFAVTDAGAATIATGTYESGDSINFNGATLEFMGDPEDGDQFFVTPSVSQDVFSTISNVINVLESATESAESQALLGTELALSLENIDRAMTNFSETRTNIGARLNRLDSQREINTSFSLQLQETLSNIEDADLTETISRLNLQLTSLEAAQQAYVSVQGLSLFNYI